MVNRVEIHEMKRTKNIKKKDYKKVSGSCRICGEEQYELLDVHRIQAGGQYSYANSVSLCCKCHRKVHSGSIIVDKWYMSTAGYLLRILENGVEKFV
jgi:5-methylcytosine-specific restriction endonuclease McrA